MAAVSREDAEEVGLSGLPAGLRRYNPANHPYPGYLDACLHAGRAVAGLMADVATIRLSPGMELEVRFDPYLFANSDRDRPGAWSFELTLSLATVDAHEERGTVIRASEPLPRGMVEAWMRRGPKEALEAACLQVRSMARALLLHELDEWFEVRGRRVGDPHALDPDGEDTRHSAARRKESAWCGRVRRITWEVEVAEGDPRLTTVRTTL